MSLELEDEYKFLLGNNIDKITVENETISFLISSYSKSDEDISIDNYMYENHVEVIETIIICTEQISMFERACNYIFGDDVKQVSIVESVIYKDIEYRIEYEETGKERFPISFLVKNDITRVYISRGRLYFNVNDWKR